ncbi:MAG: PAS domain-containing protein [Alphaproteobacteria bacterium]|nr:PAS domain-containing protein [Alphaproteobacteria bacterium]MBO6861001.1 PAS domain-containing protein [Alphaproteobacteria bacterium]
MASQKETVQSITSASLKVGESLALYPDLVWAHDYWDTKRANRIAPRRRDIDPLEMPDILPRILLADVIDGPDGIDFRYRLSGTGICNVHGKELTALRPRDLSPAAYGELIHGHYLDACRRRAPRADVIILQTDQRSRSYARLLLPLSDDGETINKLMAVDSETQNDLQEFLSVVEGLRCDEVHPRMRLVRGT